jgi:CheY-like chemotaxis protein
LTTKAQAHGKIHTVSLSTLASAQNYLATIDTSAPTVVLVSLAFTQESSIASHPLFGSIYNVHQRFPNCSVLVLGERDDLNDRLAVVRHGGKFLGTTTLSVEQILMAATSLLQPANSIAKVMVVDDDLDWLRALPKLLQPWGLKVTTLADPQQFWMVLQVVQPDALVLDVKMPEINGLELCQVLRSDPHWQRLPILFLSATNDPLSQQAAFGVGADDYLCKPIGGGELAQRIRHRLSRR